MPLYLLFARVGNTERSNSTAVHSLKGGFDNSTLISVVLRMIEDTSQEY